MKNFEEYATQSLLENNLISRGQADEIVDYRRLKIFSLYKELRMLLYLSVLLFTSGVGIIVYQNIDTIGHIVILAIMLLLILLLFYYCIRNSGGFRREQTAFANPVNNYLLLAANLLTCIFIGYLQFQYNTFGTHYGLATIVPTIIALVAAYYFDDGNALTIGITGVAAYVGLVVSPQAILNNELYGNNMLGISALILGIVLILWAVFTVRKGIKAHFYFIFLTFALHLIGLAIINNLFGPAWLMFFILLGMSTLFFYKASISIHSVSIFVFNILYGFIGFNIMIYKLDIISFEWWGLLIILLPVYFGISVYLFIKLIKNFNKNKIDDHL